MTPNLFCDLTPSGLPAVMMDLQQQGATIHLGWALNSLKPDNMSLFNSLCILQPWFPSFLILQIDIPPDWLTIVLTGCLLERPSKTKSVAVQCRPADLRTFHMAADVKELLSCPASEINSLTSSPGAPQDCQGWFKTVSNIWALRLSVPCHVILLVGALASYCSNQGQLLSIGPGCDIHTGSNAMSTLRKPSVQTTAKKTSNHSKRHELGSEQSTTSVAQHFVLPCCAGRLQRKHRSQLRKPRWKGKLLVMFVRSWQEPSHYLFSGQSTQNAQYLVDTLTYTHLASKAWKMLTCGQKCSFSDWSSTMVPSGCASGCGHGSGVFPLPSVALAPLRVYHT